MASNVYRLKNYIIMAQNFYTFGDYDRALSAYKKALKFADDIDKENILFEIRGYLYYFAKI